ncbi:hypothetical protein AWJ14_11755 [Hoeflea olei]|uniref:Gcp-like domain-containing protein n=1 Tax=Hoeflea olei TaxID=1480615 RepID=A0A1C1YQW5_9HYPH|nr:hypothetical protein AWJ14_11755 [Hoeflea olei]
MTLAIDCSARYCAVALHEDAGDRILASASPDIGRGHAEQLPGIATSVLAQAGRTMSDLNRIAVTIGPGSFAGIRVGVSFARGLSLALGVPCVGVGALDAMAAPAAEARATPVMAVLDARRGKVWALVAEAGGAVAFPGAELSPAEAARHAQSCGADLLGSGAALLAEIDPALGERVLGDPAAPAIGDVARLAARLDPSANPPEPRYLREADAKPQTGFALPHESAGQWS